MNPSPVGDAPRRPRSAGDLFRVFNRLALQGFGGVLPVAQRELVEREQWLTQQQFVELLALSQVLPGPNIINLAIVFGDRHFGLRGAAAAVAGMLTVPTFIVLAMTLVHQSFQHHPAVAGALRGMGAVAAGLILSTALKLLPTLRGNAMGRTACWAVLGGTFVAVGLLRWPLAWVVLGLGGAAMAWAARRLAAKGTGP
ncbi:chromate transport protein ChrA [Burkholderiales bacterium JOSHI_001]|nr:chromate transport protein ChrA [Burkholderiales bacterium JOSHI_001]